MENLYFELSPHLLYNTIETRIPLISPLHKRVRSLSIKVNFLVEQVIYIYT